MPNPRTLGQTAMPDITDLGLAVMPEPRALSLAT